MKYYRLAESVKRKVIGTYPQVNNGVFKTTWDSEHSILIVFKEKIISTNIEIPQLILNNKAKLTDVLSVSFISFQLVTSEKLKKLIESTNYNGVQYFKTSVLLKDNISQDVWILNPFEFRNNYIDFQSSIIKCSDGAGVSFLNVDSQAAFDALCRSNGKEERKIYVINEVSLDKSIIKEDFFLLDGVSGGIGYFFSEKLKSKIEEAGCTGIDFAEVNCIN